MAYTATYISTTSFSVTGDETLVFYAGRKVQGDCGVDGLKTCTVVSSSFSSVTTVVVSGDALTSNLATVKVGIGTESLPSHAASHATGQSDALAPGDIGAATSDHAHSGTYEPVDATILRQADVDTTPVDEADTAPISSSWAYSHNAKIASSAGSGHLPSTSAASDGDVATVQSDGSVAWEAATGGGLPTETIDSRSVYVAEKDLLVEGPDGFTTGTEARLYVGDQYKRLVAEYGGKMKFVSNDALSLETSEGSNVEIQRQIQIGGGSPGIGKVLTCQDANGLGAWVTPSGGSGSGLTTTAVKTATYTAAANEYVPCDTTSAAWTLTLPASPSAGDMVGVADYAGSFSTNNLTVSRNSLKINGASEDLVLDVDDTVVVLRYLDATEGWKVEYLGPSAVGTASEVVYDPATSGLTATTVQAAVDEVVAEYTPKLTANTTVNLNNTMTAAQIQALIDAQPKNLNGYLLTFQFADGTYTLSSTLTWNGFNNGTVWVLGNGSNNTLSQSKNVILDFSGGSGKFFLAGCACIVGVYYIHVKVASTVVAFHSYRSSNNTTIAFCYAEIATTTPGSRGFLYQEGGVFRCAHNYVKNGQIGVMAWLFSIGSIETCASDATFKPSIGTYVDMSLAVKSGTQFAGTTAETVVNGGQLNSANGIKIGTSTLGSYA